jgi:hypothetical protein
LKGPHILKFVLLSCEYIEAGSKAGGLKKPFQEITIGKKEQMEIE